MSNYPFKNLVFRGGGILGIAYLGALKVLDEQGILPNIKRVSGASAGAITALVTSMCTSADEIRDIANQLDFKKVPDKLESQFEIPNPSKIIDIFEDFACVKRLTKQFGWYSSEYFYHWILDQVDKKFKHNSKVSKEVQKKKGLQTFADFKAAGFRDLYISVTNISKHQNEIFSTDSTPDMPVADAVRKSMSIPLYFESVEYNGDLYADGGTVNNYPMEVFDFPQFLDKADLFVDGVNRETLGCHLYTSAESKVKKEAEKKAEKKQKKYGLINYIEDVFLTLMQTQMIEFNKTPNLIKRSAQIDDLGFSAVDFDIEADSGDPFRQPLPMNPYDQLYRSGYNSMQNYLNNYR